MTARDRYNQMGKAVALDCAERMRKFWRDTTKDGIKRVYPPGSFGGGEGFMYAPSDAHFIEYIPLPARVVVSRNGITGEIRVTPSVPKAHTVNDSFDAGNGDL